MTPVLLAWSGGKDSTLVLQRLREDSSYEVVGLMTTVSAQYERICIHGVRRSILQAQTQSLGLPVIEVPLPENCSNADYESAWSAGLQRARVQLGPVQHLAYGDLFLEDIRQFREQQGRRLGYEPVFPLWGQPTPELAREFIAAGHVAYLSCVDTTQLAPEFAGRRFDASLLAELPASVDPCGERGEFHTIVVASPLFARPIAVEPGERVRREGRFEYADFLLQLPAHG